MSCWASDRGRPCCDENDYPTSSASVSSVQGKERLAHEQAIPRCTYLERPSQLNVHRLVLRLPWRRYLKRGGRHARVTRRCDVVLLIDEGLIDLEGLHLRHRLRVALALAWLATRLPLLLLAHRRDLSLQIRTILVHTDTLSLNGKRFVVVTAQI